MRFNRYNRSTKFNNQFQKHNPVQFQKFEKPAIKWNKISDSEGLDKARMVDIFLIMKHYIQQVRTQLVTGGMM